MTRPRFSAKHNVTLDQETDELLSVYAATVTHKPKTTTIAMIVQQFFMESAREGSPAQFASAIEGMEERIIATLSGQSEDTQEILARVVRMTVMLEKLAGAILLHAPKSTEEVSVVTKRGEDRLNKFMALVNTTLKEQREAQ